MAKDFLAAGHVNIRIKHDDPDWFSNDKEYHFGTQSNRGVTLTILKTPDRQLRIDITGPLRFPQTVGVVTLSPTTALPFFPSRLVGAGARSASTFKASW